MQPVSAFSLLTFPILGLPLGRKYTGLFTSNPVSQSVELAIGLTFLMLLTLNAVLNGVYIHTEVRQGVTRVLFRTAPRLSDWE